MPAILLLMVTKAPWKKLRFVYSMKLLDSHWNCVLFLKFT